MELEVGIYGEREEDFPEAERLLRDFYKSEGVSVPILRFSSVPQLAAFCGGLEGKGKVFFPLLVRKKYLCVLFPLVTKMTDKTDEAARDITLEIVSTEFPCPPDFCRKNRKNFLPPEDLCLPAEDGIREFFPEQILYLETNGRNVLIHTEKETSEILLTMKAMREKLKCNQLFVQPHMSFLVNLAWVKRTEGSEAILRNGERIPLSQKRAVEFRNSLHRYVSSLFSKQ